MYRMYFLRKTLKQTGKKMETHIEEFNKAGNVLHRTVRNYLGGRLTRKNVGKVTKKDIRKLMKTIDSELRDFPYFPVKNARFMRSIIKGTIG